MSDARASRSRKRQAVAAAEDGGAAAVAVPPRPAAAPPRPPAAARAAPPRPAAPWRQAPHAVRDDDFSIDAIISRSIGAFLAPPPRLEFVYAMTESLSFTCSGSGNCGDSDADVEPTRLFYTVKAARAALHSAIASDFSFSLEDVYRSRFNESRYVYPAAAAGVAGRGAESAGMAAAADGEEDMAAAAAAAGGDGEEDEEAGASDEEDEEAGASEEEDEEGDDDDFFDAETAAVEALMAGEPRAEAFFDLSGSFQVGQWEYTSLSQTWRANGTGYATITLTGDAAEAAGECGGEFKYAWSVRKIKIT